MHLTNFHKEYPQNLKFNVKRPHIFHLILDGILAIWTLFVKNRTVGGGWAFLMGKIC